MMAGYLVRQFPRCRPINWKKRRYFPKLPYFHKDDLVTSSGRDRTYASLTKYNAGGHSLSLAVTPSTCSSSTDMNFNANKFYASIYQRQQEAGQKQSKRKSNRGNAERHSRNQVQQRKQTKSDSRRPRNANLRHRRPETCQRSKNGDNYQDYSPEISSDPPQLPEPTNQSSARFESPGLVVLEQENNCSESQDKSCDIVLDVPPSELPVNLNVNSVPKATGKRARKRLNKHMKAEALMKLFAFNPKKGVCSDNSAKQKYYQNMINKWQKSGEIENVLNKPQGLLGSQNSVAMSVSSDSKEWPSLSEVQKQKDCAEKPKTKSLSNDLPELLHIATKFLGECDGVIASDGNSGRYLTSVGSFKNQQSGIRGTPRNPCGIMKNASNLNEATKDGGGRHKIVNTMTHHKTWASVAAPINVSTTRVALSQSSNIRRHDSVTAWSNEKTVRRKIAFPESITKKWKQKRMSKPVISNRSLPGSNKSNGKLNCHQYFCEDEEITAKHCVTRSGCKAQRSGQMEKEIPFFRDNETFQTEEITSVKSDTNNFQKTLFMDKMLSIYTQSTGPIFCLHEHDGSETKLPVGSEHSTSGTQAMSVIMVDERHTKEEIPIFNETTENDSSNFRFTFTSPQSPRKARSKFGDYRSKQGSPRAVDCRRCLCKVRSQRSTPAEEQDIVKQKKVSWKFRDLLRRDRGGRLDVKTMTENRLKGKKWQHLQQNMCEYWSELQRKQNGRHQAQLSFQQTPNYPAVFDSKQLPDYQAAFESQQSPEFRQEIDSQQSPEYYHTFDFPHSPDYQQTFHSHSH